MSIKFRMSWGLALFSFPSILILMNPSPVLANAQAAPKQDASQQEKTLRTYFAELLKKRTIMAGTVLRGDSPEGFAGRSSQATFLTLADQVNFKVLPSSKKMRLAWESRPEQKWLLRIGEVSMLVTGGYAEVDVPATAMQELNTWELTVAQDTAKRLTGYWFYLQGVDAKESGVLTDMMASHRAQGLSDSVGYREVCQWMHQEKMLNFNEWCVVR